VESGLRWGIGFEDLYPDVDINEVKERKNKIGNIEFYTTQDTITTKENVA